MVVITGPYQVSHLICGDPRLDATGGPRHMGGPPNRFCVWLAPPNAPFEPPMFVPDQGHRQVSEVHVPHVTQRLGQSREHEPILQEKINKNITGYKHIHTHMSTNSRNLKTKNNYIWITKKNYHLFKQSIKLYITDYKHIHSHMSKF
jgi:hypothetical protein